MKPIDVIEGCSADKIPDAVFSSREPLVLKGLVKNWPAVIAAQESADAVNNYICRFYTGGLVNAAIGDEGNDGRVFYNEDMSGFNYTRQRIHLDKILASIRSFENVGSSRAF